MKISEDIPQNNNEKEIIQNENSPIKISLIKLMI